MTRVAFAGSPTSTAEGNTENACTNDRQKVMLRPGSSKGKKICRKRAAGRAPSVAAACSSAGSMPVTWDSVSRKVNGKPVISSDSRTPQ